jgi:hypothetical protein
MIEMKKTNIGRKTNKVICEHCGCEFDKPLSEIKRSEKYERKHFCSRTCVGKHSGNWYNPNATYYDITKHSGNSRDKYTNFRYHFRNIKRRNKDVDITMDDMMEIWDSQEGICPFTGVKLILNSYTKIVDNILFVASLDRIDSSKGYIKGNVRWISKGINFMKSDKNDEEVWEMCRMIYENYKKINHPENQSGLL